MAPQTHEDGTSFKLIIRQARERKGWAVSEAATRFDCTPTHWRNYEAGRSLPAFERVDMLCELLGVEPLATFRAWVRSKLPGDTSKRLRNILCHVETRPPSQALDQASARTRSLLYDAGLFPMDDPTANAAFVMIENLVNYRAGLTCWPSRYESPTVFELPARLDDVKWKMLSSQKLIMQRNVAYAHRGIGFDATVVRIPPGVGAYHRTTKRLDPGFEFFNVLDGDGHALFEKNAQKEWHAVALRRSVVGVHAGNAGHAFLNSGRAPLLVFVVCVPFPPHVPRAARKSDSKSPDDVEILEFHLENMESEALPVALKARALPLIRSN